MRLIDADALMDDIKRDTKKAIDEGDKAGSFWFGYAAGSVIAQPTIQPEKAQLSQEGTTSDQPVATDTNVGDTISRQQAIDALDCISGVEEVLRSLPTVQPEPAIPLSWIEGKIEWLNNMDNYFAELTANVIKTMLNEWRKGEQDATN